MMVVVQPLLVGYGESNATGSVRRPVSHNIIEPVFPKPLADRRNTRCRSRLRVLSCIYRRQIYIWVNNTGTVGIYTGQTNVRSPRTYKTAWTAELA